MEAPIYCKNCDRRNSWEHKTALDVKLESGVVYELGYQCKCGSKTWRKNEGDK